MINVTDRIVVRKAENLESAVRTSIASAVTCLDTRILDNPEHAAKSHVRTFTTQFLDDGNRLGEPFNEAFLKLAFSLVQTGSSNQGVGPILKDLKAFVPRLAPSAMGIAYVKQGLRMVLVDLWQNGAILLPTVFTPRGQFRPISVDNNLYKFILSYGLATGPSKRINGQASIHDSQRILWHMPHVLWATSWSVPHDVTIEELANFQRAQRLFVSGHSSVPILPLLIPWSLFLNELQRTFPDQVPFTKDELKLYSRWALGCSSLDASSFSEYRSPAVRLTSTSTTNGESNVEGSPKSSSRKDKKKLSSSKAPSNSQQALEQLAGTGRHSDILQYFAACSQYIRREGLDWLRTPASYVGREHVRDLDLQNTWSDVFRAYIRHRVTVKGFESNKETIAALNLLADYLFLYLPWWKELYQNAVVALPRSPREFVRFSFVYRTADEPLDHFPMTFLDVLKLRRRTNDTQYSVIKQVSLFFSFVEGAYSENDDVAGKSFRNPILDEFDLPTVGKPSKTTKVVFTKAIYGYVTLFGYAVEAFGQYLQACATNGKMTQEDLLRLSSQRFIDTTQAGYVPYVYFFGKVTPLFSVPNVFGWYSRAIKRPGDFTAQLLIPHITTLRLLIAAIETGLRLSSLRWLDRRTWDQDNVGCPDIGEFSFNSNSRYTYSLSVNTDKRKERPWDTIIVYRVRGLLQREQYFQLSINEKNMCTEVPYQGRKVTRFAPILPLFRSATSASCISGTNYADVWVRFLVGFQEFYKDVTGKYACLVRIAPTVRAGSAPEEAFQEDGTRYCPISILAIHTPHACRASFATNRQGLLETSEIGRVIGQDDINVTVYYQKPATEDLSKKLEECDKYIMAGGFCRISDNYPQHIRADSDESPLSQAFTRDRKKAMSEFGFMPSMSLWSIDEVGALTEDAVEELRSGPMALVRFRETHICPVGEECPSEVIRLIGTPRRCGLCPLALKCIDHLPAIAAKKHSLVERIRYLNRQKERLDARGETRRIEEIWEEIDLETNEFMGWEFSHEILTKIHSERAESEREHPTYYAGSPEIVRRHLELVVKKTGQTEFLLHRIVESDVYPSFQSPEIQAVAALFRRKLMAGKVKTELLDLPCPEDIEIAAKFLRTVMQANGLLLADIAKELDEGGSRVLPSESLLGIS